MNLDCCISLRLQTSATHIRVCDFVVLNADAPREDVPTVAPLLCVEVLSPGQRPEDERDALDDYLFMGVKNIWLIDSTRHSAFTFDSTGLHKAGAANLTVPNLPIRLDFTILTAKSPSAAS